MEMFEGAYKLIWKKVLKYPELNKYWENNIHKKTYPVLHYQIKEEAIIEILSELQSMGDITEFEMYTIYERRCHRDGYLRKNYSHLFT